MAVGRLGLESSIVIVMFHSIGGDGVRGFDPAPSSSRRIFIDDAGHLPQLEKPAEFNRIVMEFLKQQAD
jgi:hypothetical protein